MRILNVRYALLILFALPLTAQTPANLCLDGLCIGESINDPHFTKVNWIVPNKELNKVSCVRIACEPEVAFRGYTSGRLILIRQSFQSRQKYSTSHLRPGLTDRLAPVND